MKALKWVLCVLVASAIAVGAVSSAAAAPKPGKQVGQECAGRGVPLNKISMQLWTFAEYVGFGTAAATRRGSRRSSAA